MTEQRYYIFGPCAAESEDQVMQTAKQLKTGLSVPFIFRAGIWKPRTNPQSFQGIGEAALPWLQRVQNELGISCITEVATAEHTQRCIDAGLHYIWIGARTVTNPFMVQEIADTIAVHRHKSTLKGIFVKNPVSADLPLWTGAIERLRKSGIENIIAIHRGFTPTVDHSSQYRNSPIWSIPIELRRLYPAMPVICDPSHIGGKRELVATIAQQAADLAFDGLMIECHPTPETALSDAQQQLTPEELIKTVNAIQWHELQETDQRLQELRRQIDETDEQIWQLILSRMQIAKQIGEHKQAHNLPILQTARYDEILQKRLEWAEENSIDSETVKQIMDAIHEAAIGQQIKR